MTPLFRRKKACYYGEAFVVSNEKVDNHIHKVYQGVKAKGKSSITCIIRPVHITEKPT